MSRFENAVQHIEQLVRNELANWPSEWQRFIYPGYVYEHTLRVRNLAVSIARQEGADERITELAALLHDIGKPEGEPHTEIGARRAEAILSNLEFDGGFSNRVCHAIQTHLTDEPGLPIENLILRDADSIDANHGYVGYLRHITIHAKRGETIDEIFTNARFWLAKCEKRLEKYNTEAAKAIAEGRLVRTRTLLRILGENLKSREEKTGSAFGIAYYIAADAHRPSLFRQVEEMEYVLQNNCSLKSLRPSRFLHDFVQ
ncbi:MAG: HD domain-containing protein, partial [Candidatus Poribacteria bacterium]